MVAVSSETRGQFQNNSGASSVELSRHRILCRFGACCCVILPLAFRACQSLQSCCPASCRPRWRVPSALPKNPSCPPERRRSRPPCCDIARWRLRREAHGAAACKMLPDRPAEQRYNDPAPRPAARAVYNTTRTCVGSDQSPRAKNAALVATALRNGGAAAPTSG